MTKYVPFDQISDDDLIQINASKEEIHLFIKSILHNDFQKACDIEIIELTNLLDDPKLEYSGRDYDKFRGAKEAIIRMRSVFSRLFESLNEIDSVNNNQK